MRSTMSTLAPCLSKAGSSGTLLRSLNFSDAKTSELTVVMRGGEALDPLALQNGQEEGPGVPWIRRAVEPLHVILVGADISGLATALALSLSGHSVLILESAEQIEEAGAGLQLAPSCTRILRRLNVLEHVMKHATVLERISISDDEIRSAPLGAIGDKYGSPMGVIYRGDLQRILLAAVVEVGCRLCTSSNVVAVDSHFRPRVQVVDTKTAESTWLHGNVVIAADGIKSSLRRQMVAAGGDREHIVDTTDAAHRLLIPRERIQGNQTRLSMLDDNVALRYIGPGGHVMAYPVKGNTVYNLFR
ncbi:hypothetical protein PspLS_10278 [Pyricularia sp. CBS 133598]|nr:hypothetical protein PspLS_10278 [Pyricularia sp. CBS 133598]